MPFQICPFRVKTSRHVLGFTAHIQWISQTYLGSLSWDQRLLSFLVAWQAQVFLLKLRQRPPCFQLSPVPPGFIPFQTGSSCLAQNNPTNQEDFDGGHLAIKIHCLHPSSHMPCVVSTSLPRGGICTTLSPEDLP